MPHAFKDLNGKDYVIGYGFAARGRTTMTKKQADHILKLEVTRLDNMLNKLNMVLTGNQRVALISLSYNLGGRDLSTMPKFIESIKNGDYHYWISEFSWANGVYYRGLERRRKSEIELFKN